MENSKKFLQTHNILPRISFKDKQAHTVKLIQDREDQITDEAGEIKQGMKYKVTEGGEIKTFFTSSIGLIQKLAEYPEDAEVVIEMKSKKKNGKFISYFDVYKVGEELKQGDDIPIINQEENTNEEQSDFLKQIENA